MIFKNQPGQGVYLYARDQSTNTGRLNDAANIIVQLSIDGGSLVESNTTATGTVTEIGGGMYWCPLTQAETNANMMGIVSQSATADVVIDPHEVSTTAGAIPFATHGTAGGLPTTDANNRIAGIAGSVNTLDEIAGPGFGPSFALDQMATLTEQYNVIKQLFDTETWAELTGMPGATPTTIDVLMLLFTQARNRVIDNRATSTQTIHNDAGTAIGTASRTDDGSAFTREKFQDAS